MQLLINFNLPELLRYSIQSNYRDLYLASNLDSLWALFPNFPIRDFVFAVILGGFVYFIMAVTERTRYFHYMTFLTIALRSVIMT